ncbi:MAG: arsenite efflux transporter metallochaperone ArsD [Desulfuromonadales bacterium]|nr:arsenite efflux transporter metallochaperone ArsD [Desulfuromonadales bacterium]
MKIAIYDPAMCCSSGVCGPSVDPKLSKLQETLRKIEQAGVTVERYNLSSEPRAFVDNTQVSELLRTDGPSVLPLTFVDDKILAKGSYPTLDKFVTILAEAGITFEQEAVKQPTTACG